MITVNRAFAPEDFSWNSSSEAEYAALAGVAIPESLWTAYARVIESTYKVNQSPLIKATKTKIPYLKQKCQ